MILNRHRKSAQLVSVKVCLGFVTTPAVPQVNVLVKNEKWCYFLAAQHIGRSKIGLKLKYYFYCAVKKIQGGHQKRSGEGCNTQETRKQNITLAEGHITIGKKRNCRSVI